MTLSRCNNCTLDRLVQTQQQQKLSNASLEHEYGLVWRINARAAIFAGKRQPSRWAVGGLAEQFQKGTGQSWRLLHIHPIYLQSILTTLWLLHTLNSHCLTNLRPQRRTESLGQFKHSNLKELNGLLIKLVIYLMLLRNRLGMPSNQRRNVLKSVVN